MVTPVSVTILFVTSPHELAVPDLRPSSRMQKMHKHNAFLLVPVDDQGIVLIISSVTRARTDDVGRAIATGLVNVLASSARCS